MNVWWVGTVSTVIGALTGALLQAWREHALHRRQLSVRWDEALLTGIADYLATADRLVRALLRWTGVRDADTAVQEAYAEAVVDSFDLLREKSQLVTLLSGDREHPVRAASRQLRESLRLASETAQSGLTLESQQLQDMEREYQAARDALIHASQRELRLNRWQSDVAAP